MEFLDVLDDDTENPNEMTYDACTEQTPFTRFPACTFCGRNLPLVSHTVTYVKCRGLIRIGRNSAVHKLCHAVGSFVGLSRCCFLRYLGTHVVLLAIQQLV